ncbi:MAG: hypothetical protein K2X74_05765 [Acetobacteraceae bacterium]|nr:hypothetical protein [Acetobacteraceae bacterium]
MQRFVAVRPLLGLLMLLLCAATAAAQPVPAGEEQIRCSIPAAGTAGGSLQLNPQGVIDYVSGRPARLPIEGWEQTSLASTTMRFTVRRPAGIQSADWMATTWFAALAYRTDASGRPLPDGPMITADVAPPKPTAEAAPLIITIPLPEDRWRPSRWRLAVLACVGPERTVADFGIVTVEASSLRLSVLFGIGAVVLLYLALALTARQVHAGQYDVLAARCRELGRQPPPRLLYALNPVVISQDAFGVCSLARFQVLLFTLVVGGVYGYVMARTGTLVSLSETVLTLLGITLVGSTLGRLTEGPVVDTPNRLWLLGTGVLDGRPRVPQWQDLLASEGEIDVTRVQALAFSLFAAVALVLYGTADLERFEIPAQVNYLIGISQAVYVAGRALPRETAKRLNEEVRSLRDAEAKALAAPGDASARIAFDTARAALGTSLFDVFGGRFQAERLRALQPGERLAR